MPETQNSGQNTGQTIIVNHHDSSKSNGMRIAGFVLALLAVFTGWIPVVGWILWFLGLIFSFVGVFRNPKGFAIAGLAISLIGLFLLLIVFAAIGAVFSSF